MQAGRRGDDPRMMFSWYSGDYTTDLALIDAKPERRANPSMASWGADDYLAQQLRRLPTYKFRRLHLNLPDRPDGARFDGDKVLAAITSGRRRLAWRDGVQFCAFVDMSGVALMTLCSGFPIMTRSAARHFGLFDFADGRASVQPKNCDKEVCGGSRRVSSSPGERDAYAGLTFRRDFEDLGITYEVSSLTKSDLYDEFEPRLNAGEVELKLTSRLPLGDRLRVDAIAPGKRPQALLMGWTALGPILPRKRRGRLALSIIFEERRKWARLRLT